MSDPARAPSPAPSPIPLPDTDRQDPVARLRRLCLALPEAAEVEAFGGPTFRVRGKIFAMPSRRDGRPSVWLKAPPHAQEILVGADPARFFVPPYLGPKGWVGMRLDAAPDWAEVAVLVTRSYRLIAPKRLAARVPDPFAAHPLAPAPGTVEAPIEPPAETP